MDAKKQFNVRLPEMSQKQLQELEQKTGMTQVQILILAIEKLHNEKVTKEG